MFQIFSLLPPEFVQPPPAPQLEAAGLRCFGAARAPEADRRPKILFPPAGSILAVTADNTPVSLEATGGAPPYRWVINGTMLPPAPIGVAMSWQPPGPGFAHIAVIDRNDAAASEDVQLH
jgi:penicillin-binding protein 1C